MEFKTKNASRTTAPHVEKIPNKGQVGSEPPQTRPNIFNLEVRQVDISRIAIDHKRPGLDPDKLTYIAESMAEINLGTPITVRQKNDGYDLIAGHTRLEAAKELGWKQIDCFLFEGENTDARIWELTENLYRKELTVLERAESINEWIKLVDEKKKAVQVAHPGGKQANDRGFSTTARDLNITREKVRRSEKIASISEDAKMQARGSRLANNQSALISIAKEPTADAQIKKVKELSIKPPKLPNASIEKQKFAQVQTAWQHSSEFQDAWTHLVKPDRERFFKVMRAHPYSPSESVSQHDQDLRNVQKQ
jgi:ParB family chromosome partitioning protein